MEIRAPVSSVRRARRRRDDGVWGVGIRASRCRRVSFAFERREAVCGELWGREESCFRMWERSDSDAIFVVVVDEGLGVEEATMMMGLSWIDGLTGAS